MLRGWRLRNPLVVPEKPVLVQHYRGVFMVLLGAVLWGVSSTAAQVLFQDYHFSPAWLVHVRMTASGLCILGYVVIRQGWKSVFLPWRSPKSAIRLLVLGIVGLLGIQFTFFAAIADSNAATATLLQYLAPVFIVLWLSFTSKSWPTARQLAAVTAALAGTALLVTNGKLHVLGISVSGLVWGLLSAVCLAFYTIYPRHLIERFGSLIIVGWCMLSGGLVMGIMHPVWQTTGKWTAESLYFVMFVVIFGTMVAFSLFTASLRVIPSDKASLLSCAEPLASAIVAVLFLHLRLSVLGWFGGVCILFAVCLLSRAERKP